MLWKILIGSLLTIMLGTGGWAVQRTATMSDRHPDIIDYRKHVDKNDRKFNEVQEELKEQREKITDKIDEVKDLILKLHKK